MRITFKDVRIEKEKTYFFMPSGCGHDMRHCLDRDNITDYKIIGASRYKAELPESVTIPRVKMRVDGIDEFVCKRALTCVLISHMNIDDLTGKLRQIQNCGDDELNECHALIITKPGTTGK